MLYTIYKITNNINGKIYIGKHQTSDINDKYFGSGKRLIRSIRKYGIENFTKEILHVFDNEQDMNDKERELVTEEFCARKDTYNICEGGKGGFGYINENNIPKFTGKNHSSSTKQKLSIIRKKWKLSDQSKRKISENHWARTNSEAQREHVSRINMGKINSELTRSRIKNSLTGFKHKRIVCSCCGKEVAENVATRYHNEKCKMRA